MFAQPWRFLILQPQEEIKGKLCQQLQQEGHHRFQSLYNKVLTPVVTSFKKQHDNWPCVGRLGNSEFTHVF